MRKLVFIFLAISLVQCGGPEPRRPVEVKTGSFIKESVERNRELLAKEEQLIKAIMESDSLKQFRTTDFGAWYYYDTEVTQDVEMPEANDEITISYNILSLENDTIYSSNEIGNIQIKVDREELFPGLRMGLKLLKKGETATFLFPSHLAYGYHGDNQKIGANIPIKSTVSILEIEKPKDSILN